MIPKVIHYCWFGRGQMPADAVRYIESWKEILPDYELKLWDEDSFDINSSQYVKEAYKSRKFAFVTDYVRLYALYNFGGIYMDTDVEVLKPLDKFLHHKAFSGFEDGVNIPTGLMASEKGGRWAKENLDMYDNLQFIKADGTLDLTTNVVRITNHLLPYGFKQDNSYQDIDDLITLYPKDYFCPKSLETGEINLTENTYTIHHFAGSWLPKSEKIKYSIIITAKKVLPLKIYKFLAYPLKLILRLVK